MIKFIDIFYPYNRTKINWTTNWKDSPRIFINNKIEGRNLRIFGDGNQTRDFLYVEDCADFITRAAFLDEATGEIINAGSGKDITINNLASLICQDTNRIEHVEHHHPQSEIPKLLCNNAKAKRILNWEPKTPLEEGISKTEEWIRGLWGKLKWEKQKKYW